MSKVIPDVVVESTTGALYARQPKVYPREVGGRFQSLRTAALFWLLGMFYVFPWLTWNGHQAVLFDLPARKFYIFGMTFWPQDFFFMTWLLVMAGLSLFFFTALAGRLWCGFACPQTVWTEAFLWFERKIEGDRNRRMKLDAGPWNRNKILRKSAKQFVWITFALWTGFTFVGFFTPIRALAGDIARLDVSAWEAFWILFYALATYGNAGYLREQVCKYMCPYARFQGAMFDRNTLIISYDEARGEPRGGRKRGMAGVQARVAAAGVDATPGDLPLALRLPPSEKPLGDCIDCLACVQVCPTGIDIRYGLQVGCIACAACIDACDTIMDKMDYPRGLIRYTTENALAGKPSRVLRPRTLIYATVLTVLLAGFAWAITHRSMVLAEIIRDRNALWRPGPAGSIENSYTIKLVNKGERALDLVLHVTSSTPLDTVGSDHFSVASGAVASLPLTLRAAANSAHGRQDVTLEFREDSAAAGTRPESARFVTRFFAPEAP
jgi:cytochrome c oxidase accessory protein FixG